MKPTFAQEEYAESLIDRLREDGLSEAEKFARKVLSCQDRREMSSLIDSMKKRLKEADSFIRDDL